MTIRNLTDLPVELLIEIIKDLLPSLDDHSEIGINAAWRELVGPHDETYSYPYIDYTGEVTTEEADKQEDHELEQEHRDENEVEGEATNLQGYNDQSDTNMIPVVAGTAEVSEPEIQASTDGVMADASQVRNDSERMLKSGELPKVNRVSSNGLASLRALCLASSIFNALCTPLIYHDLKIFEPEKIQDLFDFAVKPYSDIIKVLRIKCSLSDDDITQVLHYTPNVKSILFYDMGDKAENTRNAIVKLLSEGHLDSLGFYDSQVIAESWAMDSRPAGPTHIIKLIGSNDQAAKSLKRVDFCFDGIEMSAYDVIRHKLSSVEYLTFSSTLTWDISDGIWHRDMKRNWTSYSHLQSLQFRCCAVAYALHIPLLVRHFPSLKHILISVCGSSDDVQQPSPPKNWYQAADALWKVHEPLDTFQIEHSITWEIACMADIPVKHLIIANLRGDFLLNALEHDPNYFPGLQTIRIQPENLSYGDKAHPFKPKDLETLVNYCEKRNVEL